MGGGGGHSAWRRGRKGGGRSAILKGARREGEEPLTAGRKMSESLVVCDVAEDLVEKLRKFRFRKETNNAAIIMKIDKDKRLVVLDEELEGISPDELKDELPERQPRFIVYSYKYQHDDGRVSYPLCFIFSSPVGCKPEQQMMYAGSKNKLVQTAELTKVFEIRNTEDLTEEWLREKLGFFTNVNFCVSEVFMY
ncbi:LOW QUALITY PROTEIN: glia maturation factor beta [Leptonychotes weddellii]|uniref:Glia maturation factor beta n=3 Tax=Caniformia TaxID=379584 RepID=A0A2U3YI43_LEPWE|nr:LOW QUALITY PROTEIN: glia maturation factor beta [Leptonychotes weddellii]